jgi:hypothetical protein
MRNPTGFDSREEPDTPPVAGWMIPIAFLIATVGSLAVGLAAPSFLGSTNPWANRVVLTAASKTPQGWDDDYVQGLARVLHDVHAPDEVAKPGRSANDGELFCALAGRAHSM